MPTRSLRPEILLVALATLLLEVSFTRIFSFKLFYYFTYVIIGVALLGVGSGGVLIAMLPRLRAAGDRVVTGACFGGALGVLFGYLVVALVPLDAVDMVIAAGTGAYRAAAVELAQLGVLCLALFAPFLASGLAVAAILATHPRDVPRLYAADLLGAGIGCAAAVPLLTWLSPPGTVMLAGAVLAAAGLRRSGPALRVGLAVACLACTIGAVAPGRLPDPVPDRLKSLAPEKKPEPLFSSWSPVFRVDVLGNMLPGTPGRMLAHDGTWGSVLPSWDGDLASLGRYETGVRSYPFALLGDGARVLIIGAAGGNEILASLYWKAGGVTAVELNPVTVSLLTEHFRDYTGSLAFQPGVELINAEGRSFLGGSDERWDLVWFVAPDSYAAMNAATSGAFVLSESYLYTVEMIEESLRHLSPRGIICTQFGEVDYERKPNRTVRYVNTVREALGRLGITDPSRHVLVATAKGFAFTTSTVLVKATPFTDAEIDAFRRATGAVDGGTVRAAPGTPVDGLVATALSLPAEQLGAWYAEQPFDLRPVTDDAPFFWHFVRFGSIARSTGAAGTAPLEEGLGERLLVVLLLVVTVFAAVFLLAPLLLQRRRWAETPHKLPAGIYFAALGFGFMFLEVSLIQRLTLLLGYPTYSLTVTLFAILISTSAGSALAGRARGPRRTRVRWLGLSLAVLVLAYQIGLVPLAAHGLGWPFPVRIAVAVAVLAPLGMCLGAFMPLGLATVAALGPDGEGYAAWGWAVNGFCSVVSSVLATILAMTIGFTAVMWLALGIYAAGLAALSRLPDPAAR